MAFHSRETQRLSVAPIDAVAPAGAVGPVNAGTLANAATLADAVPSAVAFPPADRVFSAGGEAAANGEASANGVAPGAALEASAHERDVFDPVAPPTLVFDGGCLFCRHFAELSELRSGIPGLRIRDGRGDGDLRQALAQRGFHLRDGAMVIAGGRVWHGAEAITWLCARMAPSAALLRVLAPVMADGERARTLYPLLLLARRLALGARGLPVDPERARGNA